MTFAAISPEKARSNPTTYRNGLRAKEASRMAAASAADLMLPPTIRQAVAAYSAFALEDQRDPAEPLKARIPLRLAQAIDFYQRTSELAGMFYTRGETPIDDGVLEKQIGEAFQRVLDKLAEWLRTAARDHDTFLPTLGGKAGA